MRALCVLSLFAICLSAAMPARAEDVSSIFCDDMYEPKLYDDNKFESYKMLVPGADGWIYRTEMDFKEDFTVTPEALHNLGALNRVLQKKGATLVLLLIPTRGMMHEEHIRPEMAGDYDSKKAWKSYWSTIKDIRGQGLTVAGIKEIEGETPFFYKRDHHWNQNGAAFGAKVLADHIKELPIYKDIPRVAFVTQGDKASDFYGVSKKVFRKLCGTDQPPEPIVEKYTVRSQQAASAEDLFGETALPQIALLGTSNSTQLPSFANFEGFLKENLSADVLNMSESGGGLETAMLNYFRTDNFRNNPAKIMAWEIPIYYDISNYMNFFREAIPSATGLCESPVAQARNIDLKDKSVIVLSQLRKNNIQDTKHFLHLKFTEKMVKPFTAVFYYTKGQDSYRFAQEGSYPKEFFVSIEDEGTPLDKVILRLPPEAQRGTVDATLCMQEESVAAYTSPRDSDATSVKTQNAMQKLMQKFKQL